MKIGVLCNSKLSIPSIQFLVQMGHQVSMVLPKENTEDHAELENFAIHFQIPLVKVQKDQLEHELIFWNASNEFDFIFVITFPYILSKKLIASIGVGIVNFHFAPLPQYKGAQPAFWLIKNGDKRGGITAHLITEEIDGGPIVHFEPYAMLRNDTFGSYLNKMAALNCSVLQKIMPVISKNNWEKQLKKQTVSLATYYPKPQLNDIRINWNEMKAIEIERLCRSCNPWNKGAITTLNNFPIKLVEVEPLSIVSKNERIGQIIEVEKSKKMAVFTCDGKYLEIKIAYDENFGFFGGERLSELGFKAGLTLI